MGMSQWCQVIVPKKLEMPPLRNLHPFLRTLLDFLNTHTNLTHDREDVNRYFEQFINYVQPTPEAEQEFRNRHCFSESVYGTLNGRDFFRQNQLSVRSKTTKTDCARGCLDPDPTIRWDIRESFSDTEHHGVLQCPMPNQDEAIEDRFLRLFRDVTNDSKNCPVCAEINGKKWTVQHQVVRFPRSFVIALNRVYFDTTLRNPRQMKNDAPVIVNQVLDIPQLNPEDPPIPYSLVSATEHRGGVHEGHFVVHGKMGPAGNWYLFDGSHFPVDSFPDDLSKCILFLYKRVDHQSNW